LLGPDSAAWLSGDVEMTSTLSPAERDATLTKLFGQLALIETLLAESGECDSCLHDHDSHS
jgi:hypothetical protein